MEGKKNQESWQNQEAMLRKKGEDLERFASLSVSISSLSPLLLPSLPFPSLLSVSPSSDLIFNRELGDLKEQNQILHTNLDALLTRREGGQTSEPGDDQVSSCSCS